MKKAISLILASVLCLILIPVNAGAAAEFEISDGVLTKYNGTGG